MKTLLPPSCQALLLQTLSPIWRTVGVILFLHLNLFIKVSAQNKLWDKTIGGAGYDILTSMQQTSDGGYIVGGSSSSSMSGDKTDAETGYWVVKLRADGSKEWDKTLGGDNSDNLTTLQQTKDEGYILGGYSSSGVNGDKSEGNKGSSDYWIVKLKSDGTKEWDKTFGGRAEDYLRAIQQTSDGGYILGGSSISGKNGDKSQYSKIGYDGRPTFDYWIVKIKADGSKEWDKTLGGDGGDELSSVLPTPDGGYMLGGDSWSGKSGNKTEASKGGNDYWLVKLNASGIKEWDKTIGSHEDDKLLSIQQTSHGDYHVGGSEGIVKVKGDGTKFWNIWDKSIYGSILQQTTDGSYIVGSSSDSGIGGDKTESSKGDSDYWVVKYNANGVKVWDKTIGGNKYDNLIMLQQTKDGGFILGGNSSSGKSGDKTEASKGDSDYWIVKLDNSNTNISQYITFDPIPFKIIGEKPFALQATATSGLPVTFSVVSGPATIKGNVITLTGLGTVKVKAHQAGNTTYKSAEATQIFVVGPSPRVKKEWDKTIGSNEDEFLSYLEQTSDGGLILGGHDYFNFWIIKLKADGSKEWDKTIGGDGANYGFFATMRQTSDGGYILGRNIQDQTFPCDYEEGRPCIDDYWLIKLNPDGTEAWNKVYKADGDNQITSLQQTQDGGYILGGKSNSGKSGDKSEGRRNDCPDAPYCYYDYWIIKVNANGTKEWDKTLGGDKDDQLFSVQQTSDGGYIVGGSSSSNISGDKTEASKDAGCESYECPSDYWLVKLRANGTKEWDKTIGSVGDEELMALQQTRDGGYILGGPSKSGKSGDKSEASKGETDYWVVKLKANGSNQWDKTIGGNGNDYLSSVLQTKDGGYLLGGTSASSPGGDKSEHRRGDNDFWLVKIKANGDKEWDKIFGGDGSEGLSTMQLTSDNGYILGGYSNSDISGDKSEVSIRGDENRRTSDFWIVKLKEEQPLQASWNMRYGGTGKDNLTTVIQTKDGGYLSGGFTTSGVSSDKNQSSQGQNDYWIVKSDKNGKKEWEKSYGGSGEDYLNSIIQTSDGGYLLGGSSASAISGDKTQDSRGERDYWVVKIDKHGRKLWDKRYGGTGTEELKQVILMPSGSYVLAGTSNSPLSGDITQASFGQQDYWVIKINRSGKKIWDQRYGGAQDDILEGLTLTQDGGFLLGGTSASGISGTKTQVSQGASDYWVVRITGEGEKVWDKTYGGSGEDYLTALGSTITSSGNFFLAGTSTSTKSGDKSQGSQGSTDYWLVKINPAGRKLWDQRYGGSQDEELRTIHMTPEGGYLLGGSSSSGVSGDKSQASQGKSDYWLVKTTATGVKEWDQRFGGSGKEELRSVLLTSDGGYLLAGRSDSGVSGDRTQPSQGSTDFWLVKVASTATSLVATRETLEVEEPVVETPSPDFRVYPNPAREHVNIRFTLPQTQATTVRVLDGQGRQVATIFQGQAQANQAYQIEWQAKNQVNGLFFLRLETSNNTQHLKLLLVK